MQTVYIHIEGLETALAEIDRLPAETDTVLVCRNCRRRDTKPLPYLLQEVTDMILPINRILFIEILPTEQEDDLEIFVRD